MNEFDKTLTSFASKDKPLPLKEVINALLDGLRHTVPFDEAERAYPEEADVFVTKLIGDPDAARAYLKSLCGHQK